MGGATLFGALYSITSEWCTSDGRYESCPLPDDECADNTDTDCKCTGYFGWQYSFIATGVVVMAFAPVIYMLMRPPPVSVKNVGQAGQNIIVSELTALGKLLWNTP